MEILVRRMANQNPAIVGLFGKISDMDV